MRNNFYILVTKKTLIKEFFESENCPSWNWDEMTSVIVEGENGKVYQIFGCKGLYGGVGSTCYMYHDQSGRYICSGKVVRYSNQIEKSAKTFVFK